MVQIVTWTAHCRPVKHIDPTHRTESPPSSPLSSPTGPHASVFSFSLSASGPVLLLSLFYHFNLGLVSRASFPTVEPAAKQPTGVESRSWSWSQSWSYPALNTAEEVRFGREVHQVPRVEFHVMFIWSSVCLFRPGRQE